MIDARRGRERFGPERLRHVLAATSAATADDLADAIDHAVVEFNEGALPDDIAIVALAADPTQR